MKTFVGSPEKGQEVRHKNGIPTDNRLENLEYGTRTENILDVFWQGKRWRKLSLEESRKIKALLKIGKKPAEIAKIYNISITQICRIRDGVTYYWDKE